MQIIRYPWRIAAASLYLGLSLAATAIVSPAQVTDLQPPKSPEPDKVPALPTTIDGAPIDSSQTPQSVHTYVDEQVRERMHTAPPIYQLQPNGITNLIRPATVGVSEDVKTAMIPILAKFGVANLLAAHEMGVSAGGGDSSDDLDAQINRIEDSLIMAAANSIITQDDLPAIANAAKSEDINKDQGDVLTLLLSRDWLKDPRAADLVMEKLDEMSKQSVLATRLTHYAIKLPDPKIQARMADCVQRMLREDSDDKFPTSPGRQADYLMLQAFEAQNQACMALFPDWVSARGNAWQASADNASNPNSRHPSADERMNVVRNVVEAFVAHPELFAQAPMRAGVHDLIAPLSQTPGYGADYDFLAAGIGDRAAFQELLNADDPAHGIKGMTLNGNPFSHPAEVQSHYAPALLKIVNYHGAGDKTAGVLGHLDTANYDNGQWTVTDPQYVPAQPAPTLPPATATDQTAPTASPSPASAMATQSAPITNQPSAVASAPAPPSPKTAVVTQATKIEQRTPSGGHAAVPLSVGAKLTIISVNNDGTVTAQTDFGFAGTVPQSVIHINDAPAP